MIKSCLYISGFSIDFLLLSRLARCSGRISRGFRRQSSSQVAIFLGEFQSRFSESREIVGPLCRVSRENETSMFAATLTRCTYTTWMYDDRFSTRSDRDFIFLATWMRRIHICCKRYFRSFASFEHRCLPTSFESSSSLVPT